MDHREAGLIADRVERPDFRNVHGILGDKAPRDVDASGRDVEIERSAGAPEVGPLRHGFQVVDGFGGLYLDRSHQLAAAVWGCEHQVREDLHLPDPHRNRLAVPDIDSHLVPALEPDLQEPDDTVVLELLADGPHQDRTHDTSRTRQ
jgi:hypothetical protein